MWIAWQVGLAQKPEVARIARRLKVTPFDAAARCMSVWEWADANLVLVDDAVDASVDGMSAEDLSAAVRMPGICEAMRDEGWLREDRRGVIFPNYCRWNGTTAKARLQKNGRQAKWRASTRPSTGASTRVE